MLNDLSRSGLSLPRYSVVPAGITSFCLPSFFASSAYHFSRLLLGTSLRCGFVLEIVVYAKTASTAIATTARGFRKVFFMVALASCNLRLCALRENFSLECNTPGSIPGFNGCNNLVCAGVDY